MAVYGLAWIDTEGVLHDEFLRREPIIQDSPFDIWAIEPGATPKIHIRPESPRFQIEGLELIARRVVRTTFNQNRGGVDRQGLAYRLRAIPSFDDEDVARMAIIVVGDAEPGRQAHRRFTRGLIATSAGVALLGILVGAFLARRSLRPVAETYEQRERFLGGAAHELRKPVASLRAICESAAAGDESAEQALARMLPVVLRTGSLVENLLLHARLDAERVKISKQPLRLDLLVETCLPEDGSIPLHAEESLVLADADLIAVAISNLISNAQRHAAASLSVSVGKGRVLVEDTGPGFSDEALANATEPFVSSTKSPGVGLGLALVQLIADLHGGRLSLENRPEGGARAIFQLSERDVS